MCIHVSVPFNCSKLLNHLIPSPNNEDYDHFDVIDPPPSRYSPHSHHHHHRSSPIQYKSNELLNNNEYAHRHDNRYGSNTAVALSNTTPTDRNHAFRRHRGDVNYDEEFRRRQYQQRRSESLDRKPLVRSSTFEKNSDFQKRVSSSFDSLDSPPRSRRSTLQPQMSTASSSTEMSGLVRRVHGMKIVSVTPETSV